MKRNIILILFLATSFSFWACKDSLEEEVFGAIGELDNAAKIEDATIGIYQALDQSQTATWQTAALFPMAEAGHQYSSFGSNSETKGNLAFYKYLLSPAETSELNTTWTNFYRTINRANVVIDAAQKTLKDSTVANPLIAEAKFMRAWSYFVLVQFWGDVPLITKPTLSFVGDKDNLFKARTPIKEVYAQIVEDLKYGSDLQSNGRYRLPSTRPTTDKGRVTAATAIGMLGKVYLTMAGKPLNNPASYQDAIRTFKVLVDNRATFGVNLLSGAGAYASIFSQLNEMNAEVLFALRSWANTSIITSGTDFSQFTSAIGSGIDGNTGGETPAYGLRWDILRLFEKNDVRTKEGIGGNFQMSRPDGFITLNGLQARDSVVYDTLRRQYFRKSNRVTAMTTNSGYGLGFVKHRADIARMNTSVRGFQNDYIILRYADVLLSYAEALNEVGRPSEAIPFLNLVRQRAGASSIEITTSQGVLREILRQERKRELIGEFTTVFDMRRWGTLKEEMEGYRLDQLFSNLSTVPIFNTKFYLYPIPFAQIATNPSLIQNPGW